MRAALLALLLLATPARADEPSLFGHRIASVELTGVTGANRLLGQVPLRAKAPLTRRGLQQGVRVLFRSGRFASVSAWLDAQPDGTVRVRFDVEPVRRVTHVTFKGAQALGERELLRAAELPAGSEFTPARLTEAAGRIASAYFRAGWRAARVAWAVTIESDDAVDAQFVVDEGLATTLIRLEYTGTTGLSGEELDAAFKLRSGDLVALDAVERGMDELRARLRRRGFYRASVSAPRIDSAEGRAVVAFPIEAGPRFRFQVRGNRTFPDTRVLAELRYAGEEPLDAALERDLAERLRAFYELAGFPFAKVAVRETDLDTPGVAPDEPAPTHLGWPDLLDAPPLEPPFQPPSPERLVTFLVTEGESLRVVDRQFEGVRYFAEADLARRIELALEDAVPAALAAPRGSTVGREAWQAPGSGGAAAAPRRVVTSEVFSQVAYRVACAQIADLYKSQGFLDAQAGPARLERSGPGVGRVVVPVQEGPRTVIRRIVLDGVTQLPAEDVSAALTVHEGEPLSYFAIEESRQALAALYVSHGYFFAQAEDDEDIDESGRQASVTFRVQEGPLLRVSRVELKGVSRTDPQVVKDSIVLHEGEPVTPQGREESVRNLMRLGIFNSASVDPSDPDLVEGEKALIVEVREKPSVTADARGGFSLADGPRGSVQGTWGNLAGRNVTLTGGLKVNVPFPRFDQECPDCPWPTDWLERRVSAGLVVPRFRAAGQRPLDVRFDLVHENLLRPAFQLTRYAALATVDTGSLGLLGPFDVTTITQLEFERDTYDTSRGALTNTAVLYETIADRRTKLLPEGTLVLGSLRPTLTLDGRDDKLNPTKGLLASLTLDLSKSVSASRPDGTAFGIELVRLLATASGYLPLWPRQRVVLVLGGRFGYVFNGGDEVIGTKRFFLGGTQSVRGFNEDAIFPQDIRDDLAAARVRCDALASGLGCSGTRTTTTSSAAGSQGGTVVAAGRAELRVGLGSTLEAAVFTDAGNLWFDPDRVSYRDLRFAVGVGLATPLPIGPAAIDLGVNLDPDTLLDEPIWRIHFAVGAF